MRTQISIPHGQIHCNIRNVAILGSADVDKKHPLYQEAFKVARYLAYHDRVVVDGGGPGVMEAATAGAESAGGETIAITFYPKDMPEFEGRDQDNIVDKEIKTANYIERMFGLMDHADAFVIFQGGTGTLSEWSTAWLLAHLYYGNHKPLILYGDFWHKIMKVINEHFFIGEKENNVYKIVKNEVEMVQALDEFEQELEARCGLPRKEEPEKQAEPEKQKEQEGKEKKEGKDA
ncbi:LOG family protein [Patescibacteria group bacterium]|nr:LOG family protein [Patescibacteria group bacterium]MBU1967125.1 LOG family protein [Patescibacteria group bacterium]MBU2543165.1 LOG family protein [Patescibacteria group bacterium]